jgi:hypothetical protein
MKRVINQSLGVAWVLVIPACAPLMGPNSLTQPALPLYAAEMNAQPEPAAASVSPTQPHVQTVPPPLERQTTGAPRSNWRFASSPLSESLEGGGAQRWRVTVTDGQQSVDIHAVAFDSRSYALRVIDQPEPHAGGSAIASAMRRDRAVAGVNGGYFTPEFAPLGRMIAGGVGVGSLSSASLVSGLVMSTGGRPQLLWRQEFGGERGATDLLQSGPRLVDGGVPVSGLERTKSRQRTFITTDGRSGWVIGVARSTSLGALAEILASPDVIPNSRIQRALNLDGGNSTAIWMRTAQGQEISEPGWSTVRNYIAIVPR